MYVRLFVRAGAVRVRTLVLVCVYRLPPNSAHCDTGGCDKYTVRPPQPPSGSVAAPVVCGARFSLTHHHKLPCPGGTGDSQPGHPWHPWGLRPLVLEAGGSEVLLGTSGRVSGRGSILPLFLFFMNISSYLLLDHAC